MATSQIPLPILLSNNLSFCFLNSLASAFNMMLGWAWFVKVNKTNNNLFLDSSYINILYFVRSQQATL